MATKKKPEAVLAQEQAAEAPKPKKGDLVLVTQRHQGKVTLARVATVISVQRANSADHITVEYVNFEPCGGYFEPVGSKTKLSFYRPITVRMTVSLDQLTMIEAAA